MLYRGVRYIYVVHCSFASERGANKRTVGLHNQLSSHVCHSWLSHCRRHAMLIDLLAARQ